MHKTFTVTELAITHMCRHSLDPVLGDRVGVTLSGVLALFCAALSFDCASAYSGFAIIEFRHPFIENAEVREMSTTRVLLEAPCGRANAFQAHFLTCAFTLPQLNNHLDCRGDLVRKEIIEMDICHPCPSR